VTTAGCIETVARSDKGETEDAELRPSGDGGVGGSVADEGAPAGGEAAGGDPAGGDTPPQGGDAPVAGEGGVGGDPGPVGGAKPDDDAGMGGAVPVGGGLPQGGDTPVGGEQPQGGAVPVGGDPPQGGDVPVGGDPPQGGDVPVGGDPPPPPPPPDGDVDFAHIIEAAIGGRREMACRDLDGDGNADNSFEGLGALANGQLQDAIDSGALSLLPTAIGLPAGNADGQFAIAVLTGEADGAGFIVDPASLDENGEPRILFNPAFRREMRLEAGPGDFLLSLPVQGLNLDLRLTQTSITASRIESPAGGGIDLDDGVISGILTQDDLDAALVVVPPDIAGLVPFLLQADIDTDGNGRADAYSLCLTFTATATQAQGFPVP
jgi:hypothetical protein